MNYKVYSRKKAILYAQKEHKHKSIIISISGTEEKFPNLFMTEKNNILDVLYLQFDDISGNRKEYKLWWKKDEQRYIKNPEKEGLILFNTDLANQIIDFVEEYEGKADRIICHCSAGISRSAGVCAAIMKILEGNDEEVFNNPRCHPNSLVYSILLKEFAKRGYTEIYNKEYD